MFKKLNLDALGVTASILCAIHCAILPLLVASLPILGVNILHNALFEHGMIALAFLIGTTALWHGFSRHHRRITPWLLFTAGMSCLIAKEIWPDYELGLLPLAVLLIVGAHWLNYRFCRKHHRHAASAGHHPAHQPADRQPLPNIPPAPVAQQSIAGPSADFPDPATTTSGNSLTLHKTRDGRS